MRLKAIAATTALVSALAGGGFPGVAGQSTATREAAAPDTSREVIVGDGYTIDFTEGVAPQPRINLAAGQVAVINNPDGSTTAYFGVPQMVRSGQGCTISANAGVPYRNARGYARTSMRFTASLGCGTSRAFRTQGNLSRYACGLFGCAWRPETTKQERRVYGGGALTVGVTRACNNRHNDHWRSYASFWGTTGIANRNTELLACGR